MRTSDHVGIDNQSTAEDCETSNDCRHFDHDWLILCVPQVPGHTPLSLID